MKDKSHKVRLATARKRLRKLKAIKFLGGKCKDCDEEHDPCVYDFHHVKGTKLMNPSSALTRAWTTAVRELKKCVLLCANCHRKRHFKEDEGDES